MHRHVLIIVNPRAGRLSFNKSLFEMLKIFSLNDIEAAVYITRAKGDAESFAAKYSHEYDLVISCGGDGTLNEVINGLLNSSFKGDVACIPTGTTNDFASSMGIPKNIKKAAETAILGTAYKQDIGLFNGRRYFSYIASFGAFTKTSYRTLQPIKNIFGHISYIFAGIMDFADIRPYMLTIKSENLSLRGEFIFGSISNTNSIGGILKLNNANVKFDDGMFELILIKKPTDTKNLKNIVKAVIKQDYNMESIVFLKTKSLKIIFDEPVGWVCDGENAGDEKEVNIEIINNAVKIIRNKYTLNP